MTKASPIHPDFAGSERCRRFPSSQPKSPA